MRVPWHHHATINVGWGTTFITSQNTVQGASESAFMSGRQHEFTAEQRAAVRVRDGDSDRDDGGDDTYFVTQ
jgi:hypothetical protein